MPRKAPPRPQVRADGIATGVPNPSPQPNGGPRGVMSAQAAAAGAGGPMQYGEATALTDAAAQTPMPAGVTPVAHNAHVAIAQHLAANPVTPLNAPTERPWEHVTAGSPLAPGPTAALAVPNAGTPDQSVLSILQNAAQAVNSPTLRALAEKAATTTSSGPVL